MKKIHFVYAIPDLQIKKIRYINYILNFFKLPPLHRFAILKFINWFNPNNAPYSITYHLTKAFKKRYKVKLYGIAETQPCFMGNQDILLAHATPNSSQTDQDPGLVTSQTLLRYPNNKSYVIFPYTHYLHKSGWMRNYLETGNRNLIIICGKYWTDTWHESPYKDYKINLLRVNMAINSEEYPVIKKNFNPKNKRKFLYIGNTEIPKNILQLEKIAERFPGFEGGYISSGEIKGWKRIFSYVKLTPDIMSEIAKDYDIFLSCSSADAQATTVLEQMCFGMAIACTPQSGYEYSSIIPLHPDDTDFNCRQLKIMQEMEEEKLLCMAHENRRLAIQNHSWERFCSDIISFIEKQ